MADRPPPDCSPVHCWWQGAVHADGSLVRLVVVESLAHADGTRVELDAAEAAAHLAGHGVGAADLEDGRVTALRLGPGFMPAGPAVWFLELPGPVSTASDLLVFPVLPATTPAPGALLDEEALDAIAVGSKDQLGALRWNRVTGEIDQLYVGPPHRRRRVATALIGAAATLSVARDRPRLWTDGQRTVLGEALRNARPWAERAARLTHLRPAMTPNEQD